MDDTTRLVGAGGGRAWLSFSIGLAVGLALGGLVMALTQQRHAPRALPWARQRAQRGASLAQDGDDLDEWDSHGMRAARHWLEDAELDEELEQTFPASDPLPYSHRID
jgi:uncharacterized membrane-anchored protein YhcB (DUF1043 family)